MPGTAEADRDATWRRCGAALGLALGLFLSAASGAAEQEVGFIEAFDGPAEGYEILRGETRLGAALLAPVHVGDRIRVLAPDGAITIRRVDGQSQVARPGAPVTLSAIAEAATVSSNVVRWLRGVVTGESPAPGGVSLVTRSVDALRAPLLVEGSRLAAGPRRSLAIDWEGGRAPYRVRIESPTGVIDVRENLDRRAAALGPLALAPGRHLLVVTDAAGARLDAGLEVVADTPAPPPGWLAEDMAPELRATLEASWLAMQAGGHWRLEAFQKLRGHDAYAPARALAQALASGQAAPPQP